MEANEKLKDVNEVISYLAEKFPSCFFIEGDVKPLKIGIFKDIAERLDEADKVSKTQVRQALRKYTSSWKYLRSVQENDHRIDLDGQQAEKLEEQHKEYAAKVLEESRAKVLERRKSKPRKEGGPANRSKPPRKDQPSTGPRGKRFEGQKRKPDIQVKRRAPKKKIELQKLPEERVKQGEKVRVQLGRAPVEGVINEINKDDIHVELVTGMVIKTQIENLYSA
ncbi:RNA chaperone ProQ [Algicola sagamiensis]|uniref:RNA chaperone ProQ n=1 Tax=Algicola sagamiensis TaxID=163869 RepID=UPI0003A7D566|nr:RNA chaperone ProQ [Algicola sagamiensis]